MDFTLAGLKWSSCLVYLDEIIIFSGTFDEHLEDLETAFNRLRASNLRIKASKCSFAVKD